MNVEDAVLASLAELSAWMRSHTGPRDGTQAMLLRAVTILEACGHPIDPGVELPRPLLMEPRQYTTLSALVCGKQISIDNIVATLERIVEAVERGPDDNGLQDELSDLLNEQGMLSVVE